MVEVTSLRSWWLCWCGHGCSAFYTLEANPFRNIDNCVYLHQLHSNHSFLAFSLQVLDGVIVTAEFLEVMVWIAMLW